MFTGFGLQDELVTFILLILKMVLLLIQKPTGEELWVAGVGDDYHGVEEMLDKLIIRGKLQFSFDSNKSATKQTPEIFSLIMTHLIS